MANYEIKAVECKFILMDFNGLYITDKTMSNIII